MNKKTKFQLSAIALLALAAGGALLLKPAAPEAEWEKPAMLPGNAEKAQTQDRQASDDAAKSGWKFLADYQRGRDVNALKSAAREFNRCWAADPGNFQSYWGLGAISGIRAQLAENQKESEAHQTEALAILKRGLECEIPEPARTNFQLNYANACNGLGAFYKQNEKPKKAKSVLAEGQTIIESVLTAAPENGKAHFVMSTNLFYQGDTESAKKHAKQAVECNFPLPADYQAALEKI